MARSPCSTKPTSNTSIPGSAYFSLDYPVVFATQRPLYSQKPNSTRIRPPIWRPACRKSPTDGKTVTVHIKEGVDFSPPVNREVTSEDVAYAIERGANPDVANPYFQSYFKSIEGADRRRRAARSRASKRRTSTTIVFHLDRTEGPDRRRCAGAAADRGRAEGIRRKVRQEQAVRTTRPTRSRPGRTCSRTTREGKVLGIGYIPASRRRSCATRTGRRAPTTARPT